MTDVPGRLCIVLHTHLPWVPHFGTWPVGEEWLFQAFTQSWQPLVNLLERRADADRSILTLGITPVVAAMLDDPYCLRQIHTWIGNWQLRAVELHGRGGPLREFAAAEYAAATQSLEDFEARWSRGGSAVIAPLVASGAIEVLGGPTTHPFMPILAERFAAHTLRTGLDDATIRWGTRPTGIWSPECGYRPGLERLYADAGVGHLVIDAEAVGHDTALARPLAGSDVLAFVRDLEVTDRVWSARTGYPGDPAYRDFHAFDHASGFRPFRVTGPDLPAEHKQLWSAPDAAARVQVHAIDFLDTVRARLGSITERTGRPGLVVVAWDSELFGHWWHEGPQWLERVLELAPGAGIELSTLQAAASDFVGAPVHPGPTSWGQGKDFRLWAGDTATGAKQSVDEAVRRLNQVVDVHRRLGRSESLDQLARETHLLASSDWAFMISRDSAAGYATERIHAHSRAASELADLIEERGPDSDEALVFARNRRTLAGPFGHLTAQTY